MTEDMDGSWVLLLGALVLLTLGAEVLVRGAASMALQLRVSPLFVALTVVAFGTSAPELATSLAAAFHGSADIAVGNVVGSNIFNIAAILGITALIRPIRIGLSVLRRDLWMTIAAAAVPLLAVFAGGTIGRAVGSASVLCLAAYVRSALRADRAIDADRGDAEGEASGETAGSGAAGRILLDVVYIAVGLALLVIGARTFVANAIAVARAAGVSELVIGLTIVAAGTSLPELLTSVVAALRGQSEIAVGNVLGSNIFNILGVLGVCALTEPQVVPVQILWFDTPVMLLASLVLLPMIHTGGGVSRGEGLMLLIGYLAYTTALISLAAQV